MVKIPRELKIFSFKDFCIRSEELYDFFWEFFAPYEDISIYRDYLLEEVFLSSSPYRQEVYAGACWEFLMGDIEKQQLFDICWSQQRKEK